MTEKRKISHEYSAMKRGYSDSPETGETCPRCDSTHCSLKLTEYVIGTNEVRHAGRTEFASLCKDCGFLWSAVLQSEITDTVDDNAVSVVLDVTFGSRLFSEPLSSNVWIVSSEHNIPYIEAAWDRSKDEDGLFHLHVTSFKPETAVTNEIYLSNILDTIVLHHPEWSEMAVYGATLTPDVKSSFIAIGTKAFSATKEGFLATRKRSAIVS
jgi:hypothetical protein